jgi:hypothetical protein
MTGSLSEFDAANHGGTLGRDALRLSLTIGARLATEVPAQDRLHDTASRAGEWTGRADLVGESFARLLQPIFDVVDIDQGVVALGQRPAIMTASMLAMLALYSRGARRNPPDPQRRLRTTTSNSACGESNGATRNRRRVAAVVMGRESSRRTSDRSRDQATPRRDRGRRGHSEHRVRR